MGWYGALLVHVHLSLSRFLCARRSSTRLSCARDQMRVRVTREKVKPIRYRVITASMTEPLMNRNPSTSTRPPPRSTWNLTYITKQLSRYLHLLAVLTFAILHNGSPTNIRPIRAINTQIHHATFIDKQMRPVPQSAKMSFLILPPTPTVSQTPFDDRLSLSTVFATFRNPPATSERWRPRNQHCRSRRTTKLAS